MTPSSSIRSLASGRVISVNGISVIASGSATEMETYIVPTLGVTITAQGPLASEVLHTLTYSPLAVATAKGPTQVPPKSWRGIVFGGIRFEVPGNWPVQRTNDIGRCGGISVAKNSVLLSTAKVRANFICPAIAVSRDAGQEVPVQGINVFSGPYASDEAGSRSVSRTLSVNGLTLQVPTSTELGGTFVATIHGPGLAQDVVIQVGLAGSGLTARAIIHSINTLPTS